MSIDLSQFHGVFFEESFEGLAVMETELLDFDIAHPDHEIINTIFRAAHSIKGGSGSFGFTEITNFTHVLETLLDEIRAGKRNMTQQDIDVFLRSVDCLREMLTSARDDTALNHDLVQSLQSELETYLDQTDTTDTQQDNQVADADTSAGKTAEVSWHIRFFPHSHLFQTGNDPLRIIRELEELGEIKSECDLSALPLIDGLDTEQCYLNWNITLTGNINEEQIKEVFEWVEDDCDLSINLLNSREETQQNANDNNNGEQQAEAVVVAKAEDRRQGEDRRKTDRRSAGNTESTSIRVSIDKVDALINMVGELVITQSMLGQFTEQVDIANHEQLNEGLKQLERNTRELQESVMQIRMLPISFSFNRFPRLVHDLSKQLDKKIELKLSGESTELDKTVMEKIGDPLVHLVRNSIDHGIESPEVRQAAGKPETGLLHLNAFHEGGNIIIEIEDDGAGLNKDKIFNKALERGLVSKDETLDDDQINDLIFRPGFSTADTVSDVSGRGVGMDVVRRNIKDLGGTVGVKSVEGKGSVFRIKLPLTLAILDGQLIRVGNQIYIIPLISIIESLQIQQEQIKSIVGEAEVYRLREDYIPIIRLHSIFNIESDSTRLEDGLLVVVEGDRQKVGIFVDDLLAQQQVVIKSLETNYQKVDGISGATILGNGTVAMILDISSMIGLSKNTQHFNHIEHKAA